MKFSAGIDGLTKENRFLKTLTKMLLLLAILLLGMVYTLYDKTPLIVERSSRGLEVVRASEFSRNPDDLKLALQIMLKARFDSETVSPELFLNPRQVVLRETEQKDMKARGMNQRVVVKRIIFEKEQAIVDFDRVIAVGDLRSALKTKVRVSFEEVSPNELNPYGLLLSMADPIINTEVK
jgi:hypothetical protein